MYKESLKFFLNLLSTGCVVSIVKNYTVLLYNFCRFLQSLYNQYQMND